MCVLLGPTFLVYFFVCAHAFLGVRVWTFVFWCIERVLLAAVSAVAWWYILQAPLSPYCWYYTPVAACTIPLYHSPGACIVLYRDCTSTFIPLWWWCGQRCLYDHLSSTDLIAHQPSPVPDRLIVSQEHQFSVLFWTPLPPTIFNHI